MNKRNIVLTGFMGAGKTTVGRELATRSGRRFLDTDDLIVERDGRSIADIFAEDGEAAFRRWEARIAQELAGETGLVIATGGRLMLDEANAEALGRNGMVFCLTAKPETILERLAGDERRPLLDVPNPAKRIRALLAMRRDAYGRFPQITTDGKTVAEVAEEILQRMKHELAQLNVTHPTGQYDVIVGNGLLPRLRRLTGCDGPLAVVTDSNVGPLYAAQIADAHCTITIPAGEQHKTLATVHTIYDELLAAGIDRAGAIIALGGGVVGDTAGFAAASYMRGIGFIQCPTTLLAMVDASVGGKTGVDLPQGKNLVGAFKQPLAILADLSTLSTLPSPEFAAGMAEVIKHGLIADPDLFRELETGDWGLETVTESPISNLQPLIIDAIQVKRDVVQSDPFEQGRRAVLNLGHTFGHAIERVSNFAVPHGQGVAMGLVAAANLSARLGRCAAELQGRIESVLEKWQLPTRIPATLAAAELYAAMGSDKKKAAGKLRFILLRDVGEVFVTGEVAETAVLATLNELRQPTHP